RGGREELPVTRLTQRAHEAVRAVLGAGEVAVDATAGNGHDTRFLCGLVGPAGRVFAFDIQPDALARAARAVEGSNNVTLFLRDHAEMPDALPPGHRAAVGAVMFNLGYRPGGDKAVTTRPGSTLPALLAALDLVRVNGVVTVLAYPGHPGGAHEAARVEAVLRALPPGFEVREERAESADPAAPRLFVVHKRAAGG
ncbi:MAG: methyltransferase domain-containing protein, partial [Gemmataceae bacterium]|nr:methyltransferase domain-containing protein [Gemmataceae bacterium]